VVVVEVRGVDTEVVAEVDMDAGGVKVVLLVDDP